MLYGYRTNEPLSSDDSSLLDVVLVCIFSYVRLIYFYVSL